MITYADLDLDDDCGGHNGAGMSRYALCCDPTTPPDVLAGLTREDLDEAERDAIYSNPSLPSENLFAALIEGGFRERAALRNPALPLYLLENPGTGDDSADGFNEELTLAGAILRRLADALGALCGAAPREGGVDALRPWLFAALWGASRRFAPAEVIRIILGDYADDEWRDVAAGLSNGIPTGDRLGDSAHSLVYWSICRFLGDRDVLFVLALADNIAALGVSHDGERHLADARAAAGLLGCEAPRPVAHPDQLALFSTEAA